MACRSIRSIERGARFFTSFVPVFDFMGVTVKGKNLRDAVQALRLGNGGAIQEFRPHLFDSPAQDAP